MKAMICERCLGTDFVKQDGMYVCQYCGTKYDCETEQREGDTDNSENTQRFYENIVIKEVHIEKQSTVNAMDKQKDSNSGLRQGTMRKGMKKGMIICFVVSVIYALFSFTEPFFIIMVPFFGILGVMFWMLGISPKESKYMFGKPNGLKKSVFVMICLIVAYSVVGVIMSKGGLLL